MVRKERLEIEEKMERKEKLEIMDLKVRKVKRDKMVMKGNRDLMAFVLAVQKFNMILPTELSILDLNKVNDCY